MSDDPWAGLANGPAPTVSANPVATYLAPGLSTPSAPQELTVSPGDKYRAAAMEERDRLLKAGVPLPEGYTRRVGMGASMGWLDEAMAAATTPLEMIRHRTFDPREGYRYGKAREDIANEATRENTAGIGGSAAELAGGLVTGAGVLGSGTRAAAARIPFTSKVIPASAVNWGANVAKGAGLGAFSGAGEAPDIEGIPSGLMMGGIIGGTIGGVLPAVASVAGPTVRALTQYPRLRDPENVAVEQVAKVMRNARMTPEQVAQEVNDAVASGQPYTVADALGREGQRKLAAMSKQPGAQRDLITEAIVARDTNMPARVGEQVGTLMGAPGTSEAARDALIARAATNAAPLYRQAEAYPTWSNRLQEFLDDPIARQGLRKGDEIQRLRSRGEGTPYNPRDAMITDFNEAGDPIITGVPNMQTLNTLKIGLDEMIRAEQNPMTGQLTNRGAALNTFKNGMLREMDAINPVYAQARAAYAEPMRVEEAVRTGQQMAQRGRSADTVPAFQALPPNEQQGVRIGWADQVRGQLERTGNMPTILKEKSTKGVNELNALSLETGPRSPDQPLSMGRRFLNREQEMQRTSKAALGGSSTAENVADIGDTPGGAEALNLVTSAMRGDAPGIAGTALRWMQRASAGENEAQRVAITRALLESDPDRMQQMAARIAEHELRRRGVNPFVDRPPRFRPGE